MKKYNVAILGATGAVDAQPERAAALSERQQVVRVVEQFGGQTRLRKNLRQVNAELAQQGPQ